MGDQPAVESVGVTLFGDVYRDRSVLVTGHTGFKGSWLALWLKGLSADVTGVALPPCTTPNHWDLLKLEVTDERCDIRDASGLASILEAKRPSIVFHLAAQSLVRRSYREPVETWAVNVLGTANVLEACRQTPSVRAVVVVTTDKCYENQEWHWGYRESDRLGGHDPYSASKAAAELVADSYRKSFFNAPSAPLVATARAGNVVGGGDWSEDRLIPDLVRAHAAKKAAEIRSPRSTRPWQHVLESASAYLLLGQRLLEGSRESATAWNFGPDQGSNQTVETVLLQMRSVWPELKWVQSQGTHPHESHLLWLDTSKARKLLDWRAVWSLEKTLTKTAEWYRDFLRCGEVHSRDQIDEYAADARAAGAVWT